MRRTLRTLPLLALLAVLAAFATPASADGGSAACTVPFEIARSQPLERVVLEPGPYKLTVLDTSQMTVHEIRHVFTGVGSGDAPGNQLVVTILSFGFKHGIPVDSDFLFDVRFLPNPHFVPGLREHTGRDPEVKRYLDRSEATRDFLRHTLNLLKFLIPQYAHEGKSYLTIGIGCTGGRHRSVAIAEALKKGLAGVPGARLRVAHRDIAHE